MSFLVTLTTSSQTLLSADATEKELTHTQKQDEYLNHIFRISFLTATRVTIQSMYQTFVSARKHKQCFMTTDINPKYWETFDIEFTEEGNKVAFKTAHATYLTANIDGTISQAEESTDNDVFELTFFPVQIRTNHNTYIGSLLQQTESVERAEMFFPELHDGKFALKTTNGRCISVMDDHSTTLVIPQAISTFEKFSIRNGKHPYVYFYTCFETFLSAERRGGLVQADLLHENALFEIIACDIEKGVLLVGLDMGDEF